MGAGKAAAKHRMAQCAQILQTRISSGQSITDFCTSSGISKNTYYYWQLEIVTHELLESERVCSECGGTLHVMGRDVTQRELVIIPAQVKIREHVRHVYACRDCEQTGISVPIVKAEMPKPVILGSFASPEAIAHIMTQKFVLGVPLYRQEQDWKRQGILLSRQTMSNWLIRAAEDWMEPIYDELKRRLLTNEVLHADETTLQVLKEPGKTAQSKNLFS